MNSNLYGLFESVFENSSDQIVFEIAGGTLLSYGDFGCLVNRTANALVKIGVGSGDRVMAQIDKSINNVALYLATIKIGAIYCPLNTAYRIAELEVFIGDCCPRLFVGAGGQSDELAKLEVRFPHIKFTSMNSDGTGRFGDLVASQDEEHETAVVSGDDIAAIVYTSGTTGRSKGAMLSHSNLISNAVTLHKLWGFERGDVLLHALPIYHVHGLFIALHTAFLNGSKIIWLDGFNVDEVIGSLPQASLMMGVPTFYTRLLASSEFTSEICANMRLFISGSAPLLSETHLEFERRTGHLILERYGMSETGMITSNPYAPASGRIAGSVGYALSAVDVRIANDRGEAVGVDEIGVLEVRGPNVFKGYWGLPEKTRSEFRADGYFISGDLATMDASGRVTLVGRSKDLIISGGLNVYPKEIEQVIDEINGVLESAVIGVPHDDFGEAVVAVIVPDGTARMPDDEALFGHLKSLLAGFKVPKKIFLLDELPRNAMGKVQKAGLRSEYASLYSNTL